MTLSHCEFGAQRAKPPRPSGRPTAMHSHAGSLDIDTLDAALDFISHYELPADAQHEEGGAGHPAISEHAPIDLTARFQFHRAHSLEPPGEFDAADISAHAAAGDSMLEELFHPIGAVDAHSVSQVPVVSPRIQASLVPVTTSPASLTSAGPGTNGIPRLHSTTSRLLKLARPKKAPPASRRQELAELQDTVKQLTEKLESLRASSSNSPTAEPLDYVSSLLDESDSVWEKLAARQLAARRQAEEENKQLWTTVDQQVRFAKNLKRKLRRHTKDDEIGRAFWLKRPKPLSPSTTNDIFRELERGLDELYVSVDKKLAEAEMHLLPCPGKKRQVKRDAVNELFIELIDSNPVPFGVRKTAKAAWVTIGERGLTDRYPQNMLSKSVEETDSTLAASYDFMASTNEIDTTVRAHRVARKYIEEDRSVIVCETVMEPHFPNGGAPLGLKFLESHILVVTPSNESEADSSDTSVIQSVMTITRLELGDEPAKRYRAAAFIDVAIDGWNRSKERDQQLIENLLMEDALGLS